MTKLWSYEVGAKTGKLQQRLDVRTLRRSNVATLQRAAETQHPDVATLPNDVATLGVISGGFLAHFEPIIKGFKAQTRKRRGGGG